MMKINDLNILYEDNHIIVVVKAANVLSQKDITNDLDIMTMIKNYLKVKYQKPGDAFLGLVHRLDRRVSGVMVFAKTSKAASRLSENIRENKMKKEYLAFVQGITPKQGQMVDYLKKVSEDSSSRAIISSKEDKDAKLSILEYQTIKQLKIDEQDFSIVKVTLITGRYNQIRVQMASRGYPLINDFKYHYRGKNYDDELGLVCNKLVFPHPTLKEMMEFSYQPTEGVWSYLYKEDKNEK